MSKLPLVPALCLGMLAFPADAEARERPLTRFDGTDSLRWQTVNDGVMGGRSRGGFEITSEETLLFRGETSLQNNGGFSSIRTRPQPLKLDGQDGLALRVRGDGRSYKVSLRTAGTSRWIASTYSCSSFSGFVSSKRMYVSPPNCSARPKLMQIDLAWPMCR